MLYGGTCGGCACWIESAFIYEASAWRLPSTIHYLNRLESKKNLPSVDKIQFFVCLFEHRWLFYSFCTRLLLECVCFVQSILPVISISVDSYRELQIQM